MIIPGTMILIILSLSFIRDVNPIKHGLVSYTDGSKMEGGTASAYVVYNNETQEREFRIRLHILNSVYQAKLCANRSVVK